MGLEKLEPRRLLSAISGTFWDDANANGTMDEAESTLGSFSRVLDWVEQSRSVGARSWENLFGWEWVNTSETSAGGIWDRSVSSVDGLHEIATGLAEQTSNVQDGAIVAHGSASASSRPLGIGAQAITSLHVDFGLAAPTTFLLSATLQSYYQAYPSDEYQFWTGHGEVSVSLSGPSGEVLTLTGNQSTEQWITLETGNWSLSAYADASVFVGNSDEWAPYPPPATASFDVALVVADEVERTVYLDLDNDSKIDPLEPSTTPGGIGVFVLSGVDSGTYSVRQVLPKGWGETSPGDVVHPSAHTVTITGAPGEMLRGIDFGSVRIPDLQIQLLDAPGPLHAYDFGDVPAGETRSVDFVLCNEGRSPLTVSQAVGLESPFTLTPTNGPDAVDDWTIAPSDTLTLTVTFDTTDLGAFDLAQTLTLLSNDPDQPSYSIDFTAVALGAIQGSVWTDMDADREWDGDEQAVTPDLPLIIPLTQTRQVAASSSWEYWGGDPHYWGPESVSDSGSSTIEDLGVFEVAISTSLGEWGTGWFLAANSSQKSTITPNGLQAFGHVDSYIAPNIGGPPFYIDATATSAFSANFEVPSPATFLLVGELGLSLDVTYWEEGRIFEPSSMLSLVGPSGAVVEVTLQVVSDADQSLSWSIREPVRLTAGRWTLHAQADVPISQYSDCNSPEAFFAVALVPADAAARTVYLDANQNGQFDADEVFATVDADGTYEFPLLVPQTYTVRQIVPADWAQTQPAAGEARDVMVVPGEVEFNVDFGCRSLMPGDLNLDGAINALDIGDFIVALNDLAAWTNSHAGLDPLPMADPSRDGVVNSMDIGPFVALLIGQIAGEGEGTGLGEVVTPSATAPLTLTGTADTAGPVAFDNPPTDHQAATTVSNSSKSPPSDRSERWPLAIGSSVLATRTVAHSPTETSALADTVYTAINEFGRAGDVNRDGVANALDIGPFVRRVTSGAFMAECDTNHDGLVNVLDIKPFINAVNTPDAAPSAMVMAEANSRTETATRIQSSFSGDGAAAESNNTVILPSMRLTGIHVQPAEKPLRSLMTEYLPTATSASANLLAGCWLPVAPLPAPPADADLVDLLALEAA